MLLDPNTLSADGTVALAGLAVSDDGTQAGLCPGRCRLRLDHLARARRRHRQGHRRPGRAGASSPAPRGPRTARASSTAAIPSRRTAKTCARRTTFRSSTTTSSARRSQHDQLIYDPPDHKEWQFGSTVTDDGKYLVITVTKSTDDVNMVLYKDLDEPDAKIVTLIDNFDAGYVSDRQRRPGLLFSNEQGCPARPRDRHRHSPARAGELAARSSRRPTRRLSGVDLVGDRFLANYLKDAHSQVKVFDVDGKFLREVKLPGLGTATGFCRQADRQGNLLQLCLVHRAADDLSLRRGQRREPASFARRRSTSTPTTTRPSRSSTPARTARGCRCSSATRRG